ncbi:putative ABC transporter permease subunit [Hominifimenecus sp. rT4P-3]|uniref:putative ABC transporter permease subunit n=1 Tax=Hominifimenecus sp. rT4P-3 TaxID=3242979 RepID=UPI003DA2B3D6
MRKYRKLTWILLKCGMGNAMSTGGKGKKKRRKLSGAALGIFVIICFMPLAYMLFQAGQGGYQMLAPAGQEGLLLEMACFVGGMATLILGLPYILSVFYMSGDVQHLLPLPLKPVQIVGAKFTVVWIYEVVTTAVLLLPLFVGYGWEASAGISFWISIAIGLLLLPIVPMVYAALLSMIFMRVGKKAKNKSVLTTLGTILLLVVSMCVGMFSGQLETVDQEGLIALLSAGKNSLVGFLSKLFPNLQFLVKAMTGEGIWQLLIVLAITAAFLVLFLLVASKLYFGGVLSMSETTSKRQKITAAEGEKLVRRQSVMSAYLKKELRLLFRTPVYFLNCILMVLIWPLIFLVPVLIAILTQFDSISEGFAVLGELAALLGPVDSGSPMVGLITIGVSYGLTLFAGSLNLVSATAISREGDGFMTMKYIPVSYRDQIKAKLLSGLLPGCVGTTGYLLILLVIGMILGVPLWTAALALLLSVVLNFGMNCFQLWRDLCRPKLTWANEQQAVKQNFNSMLSMLIIWVFGGLVGVLFGWLYWKLELSLVLLAGVFTVALAILDILLYRLLLRSGERKIAKYE